MNADFHRPFPPLPPLHLTEGDALPPAHLKARVTRALAEHGLLKARHPVQRRLGLVIGVSAVTVTLFGTGLALGRHEGPRTRDTRPTYALLLYEGPHFRPGRPEGADIAEYSAWAAGLRARGMLVRGEALAPAGRLLHESARGVAVDSTAAVSNQDVMAGFFLIHARDAAEALTIARTCPHLAHGGTIALRSVIPTS